MDKQGMLSGTLYRPEFEQDSCGFGLIAHMDDQASHWLVQTAIQSLARLTHRGAVAADGKSGDGCGLLFSKPDAFLRAVAHDAGIELGELYAAGLVFLPPATADFALATLKEELAAQGLALAGLRQVPTDNTALGEYALATLPDIRQVFVNAPADLSEEIFERRLYMARRRAEKALAHESAFYIPTLSARVLSYKGLVTPENLPVFYPDLNDERFAARLAVYHQRFSTNTWPEWRLAQPFRLLAHNGEINTLQGNRNWARARENTFVTPFLPNMDDVRPMVSMTGSDSSSMDNMLEGLVMGGVPLFRALRLMVPPAWQNVDTMDPDLRAFYEYNSMHMEPWDGPAGIVLTDGRYGACILDRNGLRPARYVVTKDRILTIASEVGVWDYKPEDVVRKGRVKPGEMIAIDLSSGQLLLPADIDAAMRTSQPYRQWLNEHSIRLETGINEDDHLPLMGREQAMAFQKLFNLSLEERDQVIRVLAEEGQEAVGSMGDDTPMAVLSSQVRSPFDYFRQQFAQVTNPPIDPIREAVVMSLNTCFGRERNLFEETPTHAKRLEVRTPVLSHEKFVRLTTQTDADYRPLSLDITYDPAETDLRGALDQLAKTATEAIREGHVVLVLSDRHAESGRLPIHALFAVGCVHHTLIREGLRCHANIVVETATVRDPHHFACLIGYGATAIYPYLAYQAIHELIQSGELKGHDLNAALYKYRKGINKGLLKILSKMGISTIASYRGAQLFEAVGLADEVVELCFAGTCSRLGGAGFEDFEEDQKKLAAKAGRLSRPLDQGGLLKYVHGGEYHAYNPDVVLQLQKAVKSGNQADYKIFADLVNNRPVAMFRDLLQLNFAAEPISLEEVEPASEIVKRFDTAAMSLGALSPEAHEALAQAMNRLGGRSNSGEGGEDAIRFGTDKVSKIKQVASGRFGVTPHYLVNAEVLQIKVAQGAKPGEGGQLPGHKVSPMIAKLRHCKPGISLISPPPHHDIYSIEDLAQLIFDLKQVNPDALVSVKLVAEPGVGTIAAGVAKAYADLITISGYDGGTGASPLTSVKYAGTPWELGLAEAQQVLRVNGLRGRVRLQTDGGLKTGLDVVKAAILGAESFGFGTGPMIALGCKYLRICHLNNCATGIATQEERLRSEYFIGLPEMVMNYFNFVAEEIRELMASLGVRRFADLIGCADLASPGTGATPRQRKLDVAAILKQGNVRGDEPRYCVDDRNPSFDKGELAEQMVADTIAAIAAGTPVERSYEVRNTHRSIGARLSGEIAKAHGADGLPDGHVTIRLTGTAGQSFGVWNAKGLSLILDGDANDYVGKGMGGGRIIIHPPRGSAFASHEAAIIGNTCLYGATGGQLNAAGMAGERFAVRNSGAVAVVEGVGDHGCEYMTGGIITILGETGLNFGAGMTGGFAFVYDPHDRFPTRYNNELVDIHRVCTEHTEQYRHYLRERIEEHLRLTDSQRAKELMDTFDLAVQKFWLVKPKALHLDSLLKD